MPFTATTRSLFVAALAALLCAGLAPVPQANAAPYPPLLPERTNEKPRSLPTRTTGVIFTNTHAYPFGADPAAIVIKVEVLDNYLGDFSKYHWVYTVRNNSYEPLPGTSNGFSGFELALPAFVPDIADVSAPDGIGPWLINCCSGLPVEWDLRNSDGAPVAGGTLPGQTEVYSFSTLPRLVAISTGWFHTWQFDVQTDIVNYPIGDGPEVPDVLAPPGQELCCYQDAAGNYVCQLLPAGECRRISGIVVVDCQHCPPVTPTLKKSWGNVKKIYR